MSVADSNLHHPRLAKDERERARRAEVVLRLNLERHATIGTLRDSSASQGCGVRVEVKAARDGRDGGAGSKRAGSVARRAPATRARAGEER